MKNTILKVSGYYIFLLIFAIAIHDVKVGNKSNFVSLGFINLVENCNIMVPFVKTFSFDKMNSILNKSKIADPLTQLKSNR